MKKIVRLSIFTILALSGIAFCSGLAADELPADADTLKSIAEATDSLVVDTLTADTLGQEASSMESPCQESGKNCIGDLREIENRAFGLGEKLVFEISYGPINAGTAVMEISQIVQLQGRDCYHIISTARSNKFFSSFFKVEDRAETFVDTGGLFPWRFEKHLREGKYKADRFANFDQVNHTVTTDRGEMEIPPYVQDVLSTLYYIRTQDIVVGQSLYVDNHSGKKIYPLEVKVHRRERVKVPAGSFDCFVVQPILKAGGVFKHEGKLTVWLTADEQKMPVLMKSKVLIGSIDAELKSYKLK